MEVGGWKGLWKRSIENCQFRYTTVVSDGDSKTHTAIVRDKVYGEGVQIKKEECINHVAERIGKALKDFFQSKRKKGEGVGGRKRGSLTQGTIVKTIGLP